LEASPGYIGILEMVHFYKILMKTIAITAIIVATAPASPTPATATKGDKWKHHITPKRNKQLQSNQPLKEG
jgi:hypothetical protein